jgi:RecA-family ATPase
MDRASGSGVFARDPDAQLDMLEIEPPDDYMDKTTDTAWQIESSLREFPNIIPKRIWFRYPLHEEEYNGELKHQPIADGSKGGRPNKISDEQIEQYFDEYAVNGFVNSRDMAAALEVSERSVRGYKSKKFEYVSRKGLRRVDGQ